MAWGKKPVRTTAQLSGVDNVSQRRSPVLRGLFVGGAGLRPWWGVLLFVGCAALLEGAGGPVIALQHRWFGPGESAGGVIFQKLVLLVCLIGVVAVLGRIEGRRLGDYGLPWSRAFRRTFWAGGLWGLGLLTINIVVLLLTRVYTFGAIALSPRAALEYGLLWAAADITVATAEEFAFRGYLQYTLTRWLGFWPAAVLTSALFGLAHLDVPGLPWTAVASIAFGGVFLCVALQRTGDLWFAIGAHAAFDWGLAFLFSTSPGVREQLFDASLQGPAWLTGGAAGPEGNALSVILFAGSLLLLPRVYREVRYHPR